MTLENTRCIPAQYDLQEKNVILSYSIFYSYYLAFVNWRAFFFLSFQLPVPLPQVADSGSLVPTNAPSQMLSVQTPREHRLSGYSQDTGPDTSLSSRKEFTQSSAFSPLGNEPQQAL